jgi:hypothetical protein
VAAREEFLVQVWKEVINAPLRERWIDHVISAALKDPSGPFNDLGPILTRLLGLGALKRDLALINRFAAFEAVFQTLNLLSDPGVDNNDIEMLQESLLGADPSGKEGRPGSAPKGPSRKPTMRACDLIEMLQELLLGTDPSGKERRPGSAAQRP